MSAEATLFDYIDVAVEDGVGRLTLNRPEALNALHRAMMGEIIAAVRAFEDDPDVRVMLIEGAGRGFSAGGDFDFLDELKTKTPFEIRDEVYAFFAGGIKAIKLFSKPTVAAVNGPATGRRLRNRAGLRFPYRLERCRFYRKLD